MFEKEDKLMINAKRKSFALGYSLIGHSFISYMFQAIVMVALSNAVIPSFISKFNPGGDASSVWNVSTMSLANTLAAVAAAGAGIFIGQAVDRHGAKLVLTAGFFIGGINYLAMPFAANFGVWCFHLFIVHTSMFAYVQMTTHSLIAHWFNKKKGLALGIAAVGIPAGNAGFLKLYTFLEAGWGMTTALWAFAVGLIVMGILSIFWVRNTPQEAGLTRDGLPEEEGTLVSEDRSYRFTEVAANPKIWGAVITYGLLNCATIAASAQAVDYAMEKGIAGTSAPGIISLCLLAGIAGGFLISLLDQKAGPGKATIIYTVFMIAVYVLMFIIPKGHTAGVIVLCSLAFAFSGAPAPLFPSFIISVFGSRSFNSVSKLATPLVMVLRACGYFAATLLKNVCGGTWSGVYIGLAVITAVALVITIFNKEVPSEIRTADNSEDLFAQGEAFFGFNSRFQGDLLKIKEFIFGRNAVGIYCDRTIPEDDIHEIVDAGIMVPTDTYIKPWKFIAVSSDEGINDIRTMMDESLLDYAKKLKERFPAHKDVVKDTINFMKSVEKAPLVVLAYTEEQCSEAELPGEVKQLASAIQNMLIKAYDKGIASYWLTSPVAVKIEPMLTKRFYTGTGNFLGVVTFGYPDEGDDIHTYTRKGTVEYR